MAQLRAEALDGLAGAAAREGEAARALTRALQEVREAMVGLDALRIEAALTVARRSAESLALAGNAAVSLARLAARAVGLSEDAPLARIGEKVAAPAGAALSAAVRDLAQDLGGLAEESAAQGIAARYSAGLWSHLVGLAGAPGGYSSKGRLQPGTRTAVHRV